MSNENKRVFMSPVDKDELIKTLKSKIKIGTRIKTCFNTSVFWVVIFTGIMIGARTEARPDVVEMCKNQNSQIYQAMDEQNRDINNLRNSLNRLVERNESVKKMTNDTNKTIRYESTDPGLKD
jgi:hypothetical protein